MSAMAPVVCRIVPAGPPDERDERPHAGRRVEEWLFTCWEPDGVDRARCRGTAGHRPRRGAGSGTGRRSSRAGEPLLHVAEWARAAAGRSVPREGAGPVGRAHCDAPMQQWTVANETYAAALDDPDDALGRAYGVPTAVAFDLEWYATAPAAAACPTATPRTASSTASSSSPAGRCSSTEVPARRWHRWGDALGPVAVPRRVRPHRAAGAVRVPRRHRRRLGAHPGRLATASAPRPPASPD